MEKIGLTLGKYAPFHRGHEYIISSALHEMDHVIVIIYNASLVTNIPTKVRAKWIEKIFPSVEVIIAEDGPQDTGYTEEIIEKQNVYLKELLKDRIIDSFYSGEKYGIYVSNALNCKNIFIDRSEIEISATMIRTSSNLKQIRNYLSKCVYDYIKPKYYFLGAPSTGKTSIAKQCAAVLRGNYCYEYGRDYWFEHQKNHRLTMRDLEIIASEHNKLEEIVFSGDCDLTFIDTCAITTYCYALYYFGESSVLLTAIVQESLYKYKMVFLCDDDIPFDDTWDRSGPKSRNKLQEINRKVLEQYNVNYVVLSGSLENRLNVVKEHIKKEFMYEYI